MIIGVMGMSGSGKSTFCGHLKEKGAYIIDADKIAREVLEKGSSGLLEVKEKFGEEVLFSDGSLNRKKLGEIVFNNEEKLEILNSITAKRIDEEIIKRVNLNKGKIVVIDCPMLHKISAIGLCDKVILITAPEEILIERIVERDGISKENAKARIKSQNSEFSRFANEIIENNKDIKSLENEAEKIISRKDDSK